MPFALNGFKSTMLIELFQSKIDQFIIISFFFFFLSETVAKSVSFSQSKVLLLKVHIQEKLAPWHTEDLMLKLRPFME